MDLEKLADEISKLYKTPGLTLRQAHALIARHVALMVLEARIDEIKCNLTCDSERLNNKRLVELEAEITELKEG